jgi:hypothetical protein
MEDEVGEHVARMHHFILACFRIFHAADYYYYYYYYYLLL